MSLGIYIYSIVAIFISLWVYDWYYNKIMYKKTNITVEKNLIFLLTAILGIILESKGDFTIKQIVTISFHFIPLILHKLSIKEKIYYSLTSFLLCTFSDYISNIIVTTIISLINNTVTISINVTDSIIYYLIMTYVILLTYIIIFNIKKYINTVNKIKLIISNNYHIIICILIFISFLYYIFSYDLFLPLNNNMKIILFIFGLYTFILLLQLTFCYSEYKNHSKYTNNLIDNIEGNKKNMNDYRIERHNIKQFLISLKNTNQIETNNLIDNYLKTNYKTNITNIDYLDIPYNIAGFITNKMNQYKCNYYINGADNLSVIKMDNLRLYNEVCNAIGIAIDNAYDAIKNLKKKEIYIDISNRNKKLYITICNTFDNTININELGNLFYTTKKQGNGIGLFTINNSKYVKCNISIINNTFKINLII